jgi:hypothetical protein
MRNLLTTQLFEGSSTPWYDNHYWAVEAPFTVYALTEWQPTNAYYGSAQISRRRPEPTQAKAGDEIHCLHGGQFLVRQGGAEAVEIRVLKPDDDRSPFERGGDDRIPTYKALERMETELKVERLEPSEVTRPRTGYRSQK